MGGEAGLIRAAVKEDAAGMARVHVDSWRSTYAGIVPDEYLEILSYEESEARWLTRLSESTNAAYHVVESSGQSIVGFACAGPRHGQNLPGFEGELYALYLLAGHQRRGYGRQLLGAVAEELLESGIGSMLAWVLAENPSRRFYEAVGGKQLGSQGIEIGGRGLKEVAYGWDDLTNLISHLSRKA